MSAPDEAHLDEHLAAENALDIDRIMATYTATPVIAMNGSRINGLAAVREFHRTFGFDGGEGSRAPRVHRRLPSAARDVVAETTSSQIRARTIPLIGWRRRTVRPPRTTDAARTG
jgi:hypothetical protein